MSIQSIASPNELRPALPTYGFAPRPSNAVDIYLTDLPPEALDPSSSLGQTRGHLIHIHMFLAPRAGKTPIGDSGCSVTIRHVVLVDGEIGVYGGGGFLLPSSRPGGSEFVGSISDASLTLLDSTAGFHDALGASTFSASLRVPMDLATAKLVGSRMEDAMIAVRARRASTGQ